MDPRLIPVVPAGATCDPGRQFHALLGLPPQVRSAPVKEESGAVPLEELLTSLSPARGKFLRGVLQGTNPALRKKLLGFLDSEAFRKLDFDGQRRALAALELRVR